MANRIARAGLPPEIRSLLAGLRWRIRAYVWLEGLSLAVVWLGATFWLGLALDYLPVLAGVGEMPRAARLILLIVVAAVFALILYRWLFRRIFARLADRSMAVLLERRFDDFHDSLITAVELMSGHFPETEAGQEMLAETEREAMNRVRLVRLAEVFNFRPLAISVSIAASIALTLGAFYVVNASAFEIGVSRLYLLKDTTWPRQARIEIVGLEVGQPGTASPDETLVLFRNRSLKAAKGSSLSLLVRADASRPVVPEICVVHYDTREGDHGRVNMTRVGRIRDGYQFYKYDGKPFDGILSDVEFDVVGFDHRVSGHRIRVVDSPTIIEVKLACEFPAYMVDESLSQWLPRTVDYTSGLQLPQGTRFVLQCRANKPLARVDVMNPDTRESVTVPINESDGEQSSFVHAVSRLAEHLTLDVTLTDVDDVRSERPYRIHIAGIEDLPPSIDMRLRGIGSAVTPEVVVPAQGKIMDDYSLSRAWVEVTVNDRAPLEFPFQPSSVGAADAAVDFRAERSKPDGVALQPQDKLHVTIKALDKRDLGEGPNVASGDHHELDVVTPEQLLTFLESHELSLRRRFEQIIDEMTETRQMLLRVKTDGPEHAARSADPEDQVSKSKASEDGRPASENVAERFKSVWSLRLLRARQSLMQSQKSTQEVLGVAVSFRDIREELINNRVDTADRKQRLQEQIADPLERVAKQQFPELDRRLEKLAHVMTQVEQRAAFGKEDPATIAAAQEAIDQASQILSEMDAVLQKMLDLESFNELLDIVRALIDDQEGLLNETKREQKKAVLDLLK